MLGHALLAHGFSARFAAALHTPPEPLALRSPLQLAAWRAIVARAGRPIGTAEIARALGVTREHLSRSFSAGAAPTLKRAMDLVRLLAAGELAKNPGYDLAAVARLVGFALHRQALGQRQTTGSRPGDGALGPSLHGPARAISPRLARSCRDGDIWAGPTIAQIG